MKKRFFLSCFFLVFICIITTAKSVVGSWKVDDFVSLMNNPECSNGKCVITFKQNKTFTFTISGKCKNEIVTMNFSFLAYGNYDINDSTITMSWDTNIPPKLEKLTFDFNGLPKSQESQLRQYMNSNIGDLKQQIISGFSNMSDFGTAPYLIKGDKLTVGDVSMTRVVTPVAKKSTNTTKKKK